jgi:hypothetical protein
MQKNWSNALAPTPENNTNKRKEDCIVAVPSILDHIAAIAWTVDDIAGL